MLRLDLAVIMLAEAKGEEYRSTLNGIHLYVEDCDAVYKRALEAMDQLYVDLGADVKDQFGNYWWIATHIEDISQEEFARRTNALKKIAL
jgi:PhnB protein